MLKLFKIDRAAFRKEFLGMFKMNLVLSLFIHCSFIGYLKILGSHVAKGFHAGD